MNSVYVATKPPYGDSKKQNVQNLNKSVITSKQYEI